jgi:hypothetical protein
MEKIVRQVEIKYGTFRDLQNLLARRSIPTDSFHLSAKHLNFRRKGMRNVEVVSLRVVEKQKPGDQIETHAIALELFREQKLRPGTLWEAASILPRSFHDCKSVKEYNAEKEAFWKEFGENFSLFALGHQQPTFLGSQSAVLCALHGTYGIKYYFQNFPITRNIWYVGYHYLK